MACPLGAGLVTAVATVCIVTGLFSCGAATFDSYFGVLAMDRLGIDTRTLGMCPRPPAPPARHTRLSNIRLLASTPISSRVARSIYARSSRCFTALSSLSFLVSTACSAAVRSSAISPRAPQ